MTYHFDLPLRGVPKGRPRFNSHTGTVYTPDETSSFEQGVKILLSREFKQTPIESMLTLFINFYFAKISVNQLKTIGDIDNLAKAVLDAAQGVLYKNDNQIEQLNCSKVVSTKDFIEIIMST
jgi:Holliday junction resolvase RusA-like endonuclease